MDNGKKTGRRFLQLTSLLMVLLTVIAHLRPGLACSATARADEAKQARQTGQAGNKKNRLEQKQTGKSKSSGDGQNDFAELTPEKTREARQLLDYILANAVDMKPVEYSALAQIEGATLLWKFDQERSLVILRDAVKTLKEIFRDNKDINKDDYFYETKGRKLRFLMVRKVAALKPELVRELFVEDEAADTNKEAMSGQWTDNARAILYVAAQQIENNPALAAQIAQQAFSLGQADWERFLIRLAEKDRGEAERLTALVISRMRDGDVSPIALRNLVYFVLDKKMSASLREHYFQALVIRLQRDLKRNITGRDLEGDIGVAREMIQFSANVSPVWQAEFQRLTTQFEIVFTERSLNLPGPSVARTIDMSVVNPATPGDSSEISDAAVRAQTIRDSRSRDSEYQKLALKAASSADPRLTDELLSKINDAAIRQEASLMAYSPLVRKSVGESDWTQAQTYALRILDPVGLVLVMDRIINAMTKAPVERHRILYAYSLTIAKLKREEASANLAKAFLLTAKSLLTVDPLRCRAAVNDAIDTINEVSKSGGAIDDEPLSPTVANWASFTHYLRGEGLHLRADEVLDLNEILGTLFTELAKRDDKLADQMAVNLNHQGLRSLARLAVCRAFFSEAKPVRKTVRQKQTTAGK